MLWQRRWWIALAALFILVWWLVPPLLYRHTGTANDAKLKAITDTRTALLAGLIGVGALLTFRLNSRVQELEKALAHVSAPEYPLPDDVEAAATVLGRLPPPPSGSRGDLHEAHLARAKLDGAILSGVNLYKADLTGAQLGWADLTGAQLIERTERAPSSTGRT